MNRKKIALTGAAAAALVVVGRGRRDRWPAATTTRPTPRSPALPSSRPRTPPWPRPAAARSPRPRSATRRATTRSRSRSTTATRSTSSSTRTSRSSGRRRSPASPRPTTEPSARPGAGDPLGQLGERPGGVGEGPLLPHQVDQGVRRLDAQGAHLPRADQHLTGECDAGTQRLRGDARRRRTGTLPERLEKSKAPSPVMTRSAWRARSARRTCVGDQRDARARGSRPRASSAKPMPPAAPAPFSREVRRSVATANVSSQPSISTIRSSSMPFCGPKVLVAPKRPVSGLSTSVAATSSTPASRSRAGAEVDAWSPCRGRSRRCRGCRRRSRRARPARRRRRRWCPSRRARRTTSRAPDSIAARISSPTPMLSANSAPPSIRCSPTTWAVST